MRYFLVVSGRKLLLAAAICAGVCLAGCLAIGMGKTVTAAAAERDLPIYSVEREEKVCVLTFDAAWGNGTMRKIIRRKNESILIFLRKAAVVPKNTIRRLISIVNYSILKGDNKNKADSNGRAAS